MDEIVSQVSAQIVDSDSSGFNATDLGLDHNTSSRLVRDILTQLVGVKTGSATDSTNKNTK